MTRRIVLTLTAEGRSDAWLIQPIRWLVERAVGERAVDLRTEFCTRDQGGSDVGARLEHAIHRYPADIYFVHRDADTAGPDARHAEVARVRGAHLVVACVPVVMSESWLLLDEAAIRVAAGNPNGKAPLDLPSRATVEDVRDPKQRLVSAMERASEHSGRRLDRFRQQSGKWPGLVGDRIASFEPHLALPAFARLRDDTLAALRAIGVAD